MSLGEILYEILGNNVPEGFQKEVKVCVIIILAAVVSVFVFVCL